MACMLQEAKKFSRNPGKSKCVTTETIRQTLDTESLGPSSKISPKHRHWESIN